MSQSSIQNTSFTGCFPASPQGDEVGNPDEDEDCGGGPEFGVDVVAVGVQDKRRQSQSVWHCQGAHHRLQGRACLVSLCQDAVADAGDQPCQRDGSDCA